MNRRQFLATSALPLALGCARREAKPATGPIVTASDRERILSDADAREKHLLLREACRVPLGAVRTTPKPGIDLLKELPDLKVLLRVTQRLHPRFGDEPKPDRTKLGGQFLWPSAEAWPDCPTYRIPLVPVLQLRIEDAPAGFAFKPGTDLLQLLWSPRDPVNGIISSRVMWRKASSIGADLVAPPSLEHAFMGYVPVPCAIFPERVMEFPPLAIMPKQMRETIQFGKPIAPDDYTNFLSSSPGTKVGGWQRYAADGTGCPTCKHPMDFLLSVDSEEWQPPSAKRWKPTEDPDTEGHRRAAGLSFAKPNATMQVYICRRCEAMPTTALLCGERGVSAP